MKLLEPDATADGKLIFNFDNSNEIITIIKDVVDYKKSTLTAAKDEAVTEAKAKAKKVKKDRKTALAALESAGIVEQEVGI